jgi:hypothetical protein
MAGVLPIVDSALGLADSIVKYLSKKVDSKYRDKVYSIKMEILKEQERGYESDDAKIETLYQELQLAMEAMNAQILVALSGK